LAETGVKTPDPELPVWLALIEDPAITPLTLHANVRASEFESEPVAERLRLPPTAIMVPFVFGV
jgi:hypothetical protein